MDNNIAAKGGTNNRSKKKMKKFSYQTQNRMENNYEHRDGDKARK